MKPNSRDTDPRVEAFQIAGLRRMTGAQRLGRVAELREAALGLARVRIRERYGPLPEREVRLRLASLWLDRSTMIKVFGWDPAEKGF